MMIFLRYINHIKSYFFAELNKNNFYMKIIDLDKIYNFLVFHLTSLRCSKKINNIIRLKGIFDFSHLQFDGVRAQTDDSGMEGTKMLE